MDHPLLTPWGSGANSNASSEGATSSEPNDTFKPLSASLLLTGLQEKSMSKPCRGLLEIRSSGIADVGSPLFSTSPTFANPLWSGGQKGRTRHNPLFSPARQGSPWKMTSTSRVVGYDA